MENEVVGIRNFGTLLGDLSKLVPDGIIAVFPDFPTLKLVVDKWKVMGVVSRLLESKLLFVETPNTQEAIEVLTLCSCC